MASGMSGKGGAYHGDSIAQGNAHMGQQADQPVFHRLGAGGDVGRGTVARIVQRQARLGVRLRPRPCPVGRWCICGQEGDEAPVRVTLAGQSSQSRPRCLRVCAEGTHEAQARCRLGSGDLAEVLHIACPIATIGDRPLLTARVRILQPCRMHRAQVAGAGAGLLQRRRGGRPGKWPDSMACSFRRSCCADKDPGVP